MTLAGKNHSISTRPNFSHVATLEYPPIVEAKHIKDKDISPEKSTMGG